MSDDATRVVDNTRIITMHTPDMPEKDTVKTPVTLSIPLEGIPLQPAPRTWGYSKESVIATSMRIWVSHLRTDQGPQSMRAS